jgi:hypothetical protein
LRLPQISRKLKREGEGRGCGKSVGNLLINSGKAEDGGRFFVAGKKTEKKDGFFEKK